MSTYNVEPFLRDSLDCIVNQTLQEIEIICIDDGSTDGSLLILKEYATKDSRIRLIAKQKNEGLAVARNESIKLAKGKYIAFVDGDDLIDRNLFEKAYELAEARGSDMVIYDYVSFWKQKDILKLKNIKSSFIDFVYTDKTSLLQKPSFTCTKILKREKLETLGINFPKGLTRQDIPVHWHLVTSLEKIDILPERLYYYRQHNTATTHRRDARLFDLATVMDIVGVYLVETNLYHTYKDEYLRQQLSLLYGMVDSIDLKLKMEAVNRLKSSLGYDQLEYLRGNNKLRWQTKNYYKALMGDFKSKLIYLLWLFARWNYRLAKRIV